MAGTSITLDAAFTETNPDTNRFHYNLNGGGYDGGTAGDGNGRRAYFIFPKPRNFLDPATQQIFNRPRLYTGIADGVIGKEMPAWSKVFSEQDIADVAEFVYREFITATRAE